jgi:hypothetical protein
VCSEPTSRAGRRWRNWGTQGQGGAAMEVDNDKLEVKDGGGVLYVGDEAAACSKAGDEVAACSGAEIEDGRW